MVTPGFWGLGGNLGKDGAGVGGGDVLGGALTLGVEVNVGAGV